MANGIFNAEQYLELYPALVEAGITVDTAWDHYATYGAGELRAPNSELDGKVYAASVLDYVNANEDVAEYFGIEVPATSLTQAQNADVMLQYVLYGYGEERDAKIVDAPIVVDDSDLLAALEDYQDAKAAEKDALAEAAKALDLDEDATAIDVENAVTAKATSIKDGDNSFGVDGATDNDIAALIAIDAFDEVESLAVRQQLIKAKEDTLKAQLAQAENALSKQQLTGAKAYASAEARLAAAKAEKTKAETKAEAETAALKVYLGDNASNLDKVEVNNGKLDFGDLTKDQIAEIKAADNYKAYESATIASAKADEKVTKATTDLGEIKEKYTIEGETPDIYGGDYIEASNAVEAFKTLTKEYNEAAQQQLNVEAAQENVADAVKALKDLGYDVAEDGFGTDGNDLFIYEAGDNVQYFEFGAEGDDVFFFGTQFSFVELAAGDDIAKGDFGDKNAFEIFAQQDGNDVVLYVETNEVGGTATGTEDLDTITLVGVDLADLQWDGGFLTVA